MNEMLVKGREILVVSYVAASPQLHPRCPNPPQVSAKSFHHIMIELNKSDEWNESAKILANVQTFRDCALHQWMFVSDWVSLSSHSEIISSYMCWLINVCSQIYLIWIIRLHVKDLNNKKLLMLNSNSYFSRVCPIKMAYSI